MPATRITETPVEVHPFDVLATGSGDLMIHAMLCHEDNPRNDVTRATAVKTSHMGPPLGPKQLQCDAVGSAELGEDERIKLKDYVNYHRQETENEKLIHRRLGIRWDSTTQYRIHPPYSPPTPDYNLWRFSCVGYVLKAYESVRIKLLDEKPPAKTIDDLKRLYPFAAAELDDPDKRQGLGIGEGENWPVALVGYLLHSLARDISLIRGPNAQPYVPNEGDEYFAIQDNPIERTG